jgi:hypothetical protein
MRTSILALCALGLGLGGLGCSSGIGVGDYIAYRIAFGDQDESAGCYGGQIPDDVKDDTTNLAVGSTVIVYRDAESSYWLDTGDVALPGTFDGSANYVFEANNVDVEVPDPTIVLSSHTDIRVDVAVSGDTVTGTSTTSTSTTCAGTGCNTDPPDVCTRTVRFSGVRIDTVDLGND